MSSCSRTTRWRLPRRVMFYIESSNCCSAIKFISRSRCQNIFDSKVLSLKPLSYFALIILVACAQKLSTLVLDADRIGRWKYLSAMIWADEKFCLWTSLRLETADWTPRWMFWVLKLDHQTTSSNLLPLRLKKSDMMLVSFKEALLASGLSLFRGAPRMTFSSRVFSVVFPTQKSCDENNIDRENSFHFRIIESPLSFFLFLNFPHQQSIKKKENWLLKPSGWGRIRLHICWLTECFRGRLRSQLGSKQSWNPKENPNWINTSKANEIKLNISSSFSVRRNFSYLTAWGKCFALQRQQISLQQNKNGTAKKRN